MAASYKNILDEIEIILEAGGVPMIMGHAGIGKSQLAKEFVRRKPDEKIRIVTVFGSNLKEGEIGGIPRVIKDEVLNREINIYTLSNYCEQIERNKIDGYSTLLFIDELNRCDQATQQELMRLVNEKKINDYVLPEGTMIICAGNPDDPDTDNDYNVVTMNDALKDRFFMINMESDIESWLEWANRQKMDDEGNLYVMEDGDKEIPLKNIDSDIIEFMVDNPKEFHIPHSNEGRSTTPRGWEEFSNTKRIIDGKMSVGSGEYYDTLFNIASYRLGNTVAGTFVNFIKTKDNPILTAKEIFNSSDEEYEEKIVPRLRHDSSAMLRMNLVVSRIIDFLVDFRFNKNNTEKIANRLIKTLEFVPNDLAISFMAKITQQYPSISKKIATPEYVTFYKKVTDAVRKI